MLFFFLEGCGTMTSLIMGPVDNGRYGQGNQLTIQNRSFYLLDYRSPFQMKSLCDLHFHEIQISSHPLHIWRDLSVYFFLIRFSHQFSNYVLSKTYTIHCLTTHEFLNKCISAHFFVQTKCMATCTDQSSDNYEDFLLLVPFRVAQKRDVILNLSLVGGTFMMCKIISTSSPSLLFLIQPIMAHTP